MYKNPHDQFHFCLKHGGQTFDEYQFHVLESFLLVKMAEFEGKLRSHENSRSIVCSCCGRKDNRCFKVTNSLETIIQQEVFKGYEVKDVYFPSGVCGPCRHNLFLAKKGKVVSENVRERWNSMDYDKFKAPSRKSPCSCQICTVVRFTGSHLEKKPSPDVPRIPEAISGEAEA